jgi:hypothetical protein
MFKCLVNYNFTPDKEWIGDDYLIYDRSDDGIDHLKDFDKSKIIRTDNMGQVDYDKLNYLVDNYYDLPEVFLWGKTNLFKYITKEEYENVANNKAFTPLLTQNHKTYADTMGVVNYYSGGIYHERNDSWYFAQFSSKYVNNWYEWSQMFMLPYPQYIPFFPGGNCILTREAVHKYSPDYYAKMASTLPYCREPAEAQCCERSYYLMFK